MAEHNELGKQGEQIAAGHLEQKGLIILERNWRFLRSEVDIICKNEFQTIFVEVKARTGNFFGEPESAVDDAKKERMLKAATEYIYRNNIDTEVRFDIISILFKGNSYELTHFEDAFFPYDM